MTVRFNRRIRLFPGLSLHVGKRGVGFSAGPRGFHVGVSTAGRPYVSAGIPGTGIYARQDFQPRAKTHAPSSTQDHRIGMLILIIAAVLALLFFPYGGIE